MKSSLVLLLVLPWMALAEGQPRTINEYFAGESKPGDVVCGIDNVCWLELDARAVLTQENDPTGALAKGRVVESQRQFTRVEIADILGELERGKIKATGSVDVYAKVNWKAVDSGLLAKDLSAKHIVHGRLSFENGQAKFTVTNVPDQLLLGMYRPSLDVAEAFGMITPSDNDKIKTAQNIWLETILAHVLPAALGLTPEVGPKP